MKPEELRPHLAGVASVAITPFDEDRRVDERGTRAVVEYLDQGGTDTLVVCGGTGEFYALTPAERRQVVEVAAAAVQRAPLVVSVGLDAVGAAEAARHAEDAGAAGIMVHQPIHPYTHPDGLRRYYDEICSAVSIGVVAYVRDPRVGADLLGDVLAHDNVVAVKYAVNDVRRFANLRRDTPHSGTVEWVCGSAEAWAPFFWVAGATGFTSGLANFAIEEALGMRAALVSGDVERIRATWERLAGVEDLRSRGDDANNIAVLKAGTCRLGLTTAVVRPPLRPLPEDHDAELGLILEGWKNSPRPGAG
ncbi:MULTISPECIES: dihydrodipicolinate synthase family protein [unclassified Nocardioides]|uniref:dihydrodipicolinate synthase family protein n=1 Tax=unclassified Nocardioides TaxID=2615069 RepID=UPI0000570B61|nr:MULTISPECIES: dihydrodipicolinate synthase family protein [unclassified Nocardioides]ABL79583.1 dihydrodipicolinate synthetase [Nocardioides sp. JS614]